MQSSKTIFLQMQSKNTICNLYFNEINGLLTPPKTPWNIIPYVFHFFFIIMCPTLLANGIYVKPNVENNTKNVEFHLPFSASGSYVMPHLLNLFADLVALLNQSWVHRCQDRIITMDKRDRPSSSILSKYMNILYSKCQGIWIWYL